MGTSSLAIVVVAILASANPCIAASSSARFSNFPRQVNITATTGPPLVTFGKYANATGSFSTAGLDLTKPYSPNTSNQTGWSLDIQVASNIPADNTQWGIWYPKENPNPTGLYLKAPQDAFETDKLHQSWTSCAYIWRGALRDKISIETLQNDKNGLCTSVLSEQCLADLRAESAARGKCVLTIDAPKSCMEYPHKSRSVNPVLVSHHHNHVGVVDGPNPPIPNLINDTRGYYEIYVVPDPYNIKDNATSISEVYDYVVAEVWPVLVNFYYEENGQAKAFSDFKCLRARDIADGSRKPETIGIRENTSDKGAAHGLRPGLWQALSTGGLFAFLLLL